MVRDGSTRTPHTVLICLKEPENVEPDRFMFEQRVKHSTSPNHRITCHEVASHETR